MKNLARRLARLEDSGETAALCVVPRYVGMPLDDAMRLELGPAGPPPGAEVIILENALPDDDDSDEIYDWTTLSPVEYSAALARAIARRWASAALDV